MLQKYFKVVTKMFGSSKQNKTRINAYFYLTNKKHARNEKTPKTYIKLNNLQCFLLFIN
ncbi:hypothetical protein TNO021_430092 [Tenacibaculum dicentrarchi]|nr:hypothetical protein TNO021_430092 [Tenacibaculum dicentrarchi]